jgi:hypothetical protein
MTQKNQIGEILADCDALALMKQLERFEIELRTHVPLEVLLTPSGEPNCRNRFGAIMHHARMLHSVLKNFYSDLGGI